MDTRVDLTHRVTELASRLGVRGVSSSALLGILCVVALILGIAAVRSVTATPAGFEIEVSEPGSTVATYAPSGPAAGVESTTVVVHVVGAVRRPGVVMLEPGSRAQDAVEAAGGLLPNAAPEALNLARVCVDGEQLLVLTVDQFAERDAVLPPGNPPVNGVLTAPALVNLNSASAEELDTLPGIGPSTAAKIVADREANGPFSAPEDLMRVPGIGPKKFESLKDLVTVG